DFAKEQLALRRIARTGDSAGGVDHDGRVRGDEVLLDERSERDENRRRIATRIRHELCAGDDGAGQLGKTIGDTLTAVPWTEVGGEIDGADALLARARHPVLRRAVWKRAEDEFSIRQRCVVRGDERDVATAEPSGGATLVIRRGEREREAWMAIDECAKLATGIAA